MEEKEFNLAEMEKETEEMLKINLLDEKNTEFIRTKGGFLSIKTGDTTYPRVLAVRMFPFTDPDRFISIRTTDEKSKEIGIIENMSDLSKKTADLIKEQLDLRYFTPVITGIKSIKDEYGYAYFDVMTDRGECRFAIHMGGSDVVHLSETRILIMDIDENRFEIPDVTALTPTERKKLDLFL
jgi:hypothetical protein